jgi:hypothetical protein
MYATWAALRRYVRSWPKVDIPRCTAHVRLGKADIDQPGRLTNLDL